MSLLNPTEVPLAGLRVSGTGNIFRNCNKPECKYLFRYQWFYIWLVQSNERSMHGAILRSRELQLQP